MFRYLLFILCLIPVSLFAQQTRPFTIGWLVGMEQSGPVVLQDTFYVTATEAVSSLQQRKITGTGGIRLEALLGGNATLRLDVLYSDRGYQEDVRFSLSGGPEQRRTDSYRFGYLSMPFTFRIPFNEGPAFVYASGGIVTDRLLFVSNTGGPLPDDSFAPWAFSWKAALGASYPFSGESRGFFEVSWVRGISEYRVGSDWQPQSFGLVIGYML